MRDHRSSTLALSFLLIKPFGHSSSFLFLSKMVVGMQGLVKKEGKLNEENEVYEVREKKYTFYRIKGLGRVHILF